MRLLDLAAFDSADLFGRDAQKANYLRPRLPVQATAAIAR
jgi:hypothetical protein